MVDRLAADRPVADTDDGRPRLDGPDRWRLGRLRVERFGDPDGGERAVEVLGRLVEALPFDGLEVVGADGSWLVTRVPDGEPADRPDRHPEPARLAVAVGEGLAALHALDPAIVHAPPSEPAGPAAKSVPAAESGPAADSVAGRCAAALADGRAARADLAEPYRRYEPDALAAMAAEGGGLDGVAEAGAGPVDALVVCHGWPTLDRFLVEGDRLVGVDGLTSVLVADRHLDLAVAHLSVGAVLGQEAVFGFYEAYGRDPDLVRLDRGVLVAHLLGAVPVLDSTGP